ncbi:MAG: ABC transporter ATP-binding protein [Gammaproteobacteria bacterium]|nr:ABC transporter ATP-binding protein [Gammaproteobacteria bacterium]
MRLSGVSINYRARTPTSADDVVALTDVSLTIDRGERVGVIGANGAGKSTLLGVMAGILRPDSGAVDEQGMSTSLLSLTAGFDLELSGVRNIVMHGMLRGLSRAEAEANVPAVTAAAGLGEAIHRRVATYSRGMRARLCFWTAIELKADVLLVDEVLAVGDQEFRLKSQQAMAEILASDHTVVLVSHNTGVVQRFCERAIWLDRGRIRADGASEEVVSAYRLASADGGQVSRRSNRKVLVCGAPSTGATGVAKLLNCQPDAAIGLGRHRRYLMRNHEYDLDSLFSEEVFFGCDAGGAGAAAGTDSLTREKYATATLVGDTVPPLYRRLDTAPLGRDDVAVLYLFGHPESVLFDLLRQDKCTESDRDKRLVAWNSAMQAARNARDRLGDRLLCCSVERLLGPNGETTFRELLRRLGLATKVTPKSSHLLARTAELRATRQSQPLPPELVRYAHQHADFVTYAELLADSC